MKLEQLRRHVGDLSQLVSTREARLSDGPEDGLRVIDARASGGLSALVLADRGLDLGPVWAAGHQVSWQSSTGLVHPAYFDEQAWLRSFHGGLLTTCGLQNVGLPNEDEDRSYGLHGRVSNIPARNVSHRLIERDGNLVAEITGEMRETDVFGSDLLLRRRLTFPMGDTVVHVHDEVVNQGYEDAAVMILYHVNLGYPVVAEGSRLVGPPADIVGRDERARGAVARYAEFPPPVDGFSEYVYEHRLRDRTQPAVSISLVNPGHEPSGGIAVTVTWDPRQLPRLWQWRMLAPGMYLTGIEPANCGLAGRASERQAIALDMLGPGERRQYDLSIRVSTGTDAIAALLARGEAPSSAAQG
ncbi:MAG: aldose 1-epimerase family protein [Chloroflexota bacterium]